MHLIIALSARQGKLHRVTRANIVTIFRLIVCFVADSAFSEHADNTDIKQITGSWTELRWE